MQKPELWKLVLAQISAAHQDATPSEWRTYVNRCLVPEIKLETMRFYGGSEDQESQYPGLDYSNPNHRLRLQSFPQHAKFFKAIDALRLTETEIYMLCKWHGSKRAKNDHERKHGIKIRDTTWEGVHAWCAPEPTVTFCSGVGDHDGFTKQHDTAHMVENDDDVESGLSDEEEDALEESDSDEEMEASVQHSAGTSLNERLLAHAEAHTQARARGEQVEINADWEEWMKQTLESHGSQGDLRSLSSDFVARLLQRQQDPTIVAQDATSTVSQPSEVQARLVHPLSPSSNADTLETTAPARGSTVVSGH